jgi:hypothetical protein
MHFGAVMRQEEGLGIEVGILIELVGGMCGGSGPAERR